MASGWGCIRDKYESVMDQLDTKLHEKNAVSRQLEKIEKMTKVPRLRLVQVVMLLLLVIIIFTLGSELICNCIGFMYPAYASIKAIESLKKDDDTRWLTYWVVYGFFIFLESITDCFLSWFPFYWISKCIFLIWCMIPSSSNGSDFIYNFLIRPFFLKHHKHIDTAIDQASSSARGYFDHASSAMQNSMMNSRQLQNAYNDGYGNIYDDRDGNVNSGGRLGELRQKYGGDQIMSPERSLDASRSRLFNNNHNNINHNNNHNNHNNDGRRRSGSRSPERRSYSNNFNNNNDQPHQRHTSQPDDVANRSRKFQEPLDDNSPYLSNGGVHSAKRNSNSNSRAIVRKTGENSAYKGEDAPVRINSRN